MARLLHPRCCSYFFKGMSRFTSQLITELLSLLVILSHSVGNKPVTASENGEKIKPILLQREFSCIFHRSQWNRLKKEGNMCTKHVYYTHLTGPVEKNVHLDGILCNLSCEATCKTLVKSMFSMISIGLQFVVIKSKIDLLRLQDGLLQAG